MCKTGCCFIALIVKLLTSLVSSIIFVVVAVGANYSSPVFKMHKL